MARIYPFRAYRYDPSKVKLEDVVTQPYDKISPVMQDAYYAKSPYNLIRVILGKKQEGDTEDGPNVYTRAAESLNAWKSDGVLREESEPAVFAYSQVYTVPGTEDVRERRGLIVLGHLYDYSEKVVFRHEQTFPKHKSDRMSLFKATRTYCEQIYMLYSDPGFTVEKLIFEGGSAPDQSVTDEYDVVHKLWKITDPHIIKLLVGAMEDKKLIIADGHHRYETSVAYAKERAEKGRDSAPNRPRLWSEPAFPEAAMMMTLVNMDAPGITILPTHRLVFGLNGFSPAEFVTKAASFFDVKKLADGTETTLLKRELDATKGTAFVAVTREGNWLLTAKKDATDAALGDRSPKQKQLDVVVLHGIILEQLLGLTPESIRGLENLRYLREAPEGIDQVHKGEADVIFITKPVTLDQMKDVAFADEVMPQKSTDFYPKLLSGLAIYALD